MEIREPKETDQEKMQNAFLLVKKFMQSHPEIDGSLWAGVMWSILVDGYSLSGMSFEQFIQEWDKVKSHYKSWFDE